MMSVHTTKFVGRISVVSCRDVRRFATLAVRGPAKIKTPHRINPNFERSLSITSRLSLRPRFQPKFPWKSIATITSLSTITYLYNSPPTHNFYVDAFIRSLRSIVTGFVCVVDYKWSLRNKESISEEEYLKVKSECHTRSAKRLLSTFMKNGGVYVKLGQHIAALAYLLPLEYVETMKVLQDRCDPTATEDLEKLFQNDLGKSIDDLFIYFNPIPIGVASLAQVHQATLHNGQEVAVKIQHPHLQIFATIDIATCSGLVNLIRFLFPEFEFGWLADEMKDNLPKELDFEHESGNAGRVQMNFDKSSGRHHLNLKIPEVMWAYKRVLCMEFAKGGRIDDLEYYRRHHINPAQVSSELTSIFSSMIFLHGFVHADPHPGNLLIQPLPAPWFGYYILHPLAFVHDLIIPRKNFMIVLLDHGLYRTIDDQFRLGYAKLWRSLIRSNEKEIRYFSKQVANVDMYQLFSCMLTGRDWDTITSDIRTSRSQSELDSITSSASTFFLQITQVLSQVPRTLLLLFKTNDLLRSIERDLNAGEWLSVMKMGSYVLWVCAIEGNDNANFEKEKEEAGVVEGSLWYRYWEWLRFEVAVRVVELGLVWKERMKEWKSSVVGT